MSRRLLTKKTSGGSVRLAFDILRGGLRLLRQYPILLAPLVPLFIWIVAVEISLLWLDGFLALICIGLLAYGMLFAFAVTSIMLLQIQQGQRPSLGDALYSPQLWRLAPRLLLLAGAWYGLVLIIVTIQTLIDILLDKLDKKGRLARQINRAIFGTLGDALRLMALMMIPIMIFEGTGLREGFRRLRATLADHAGSALAGLALTKLATGAIALVLYVTLEFLPTESALLMVVVGMPLLAAGWFVAIYLEQIFVTGLYLYSALPTSPLVAILLERQLGRELPLPAPAPGAA